jgi:hypothetical protein
VKYIRLGAVLLPLTLADCGMPSAPIGVPSDQIATSEGAVVDLSRIITEMKCNVREWIALDEEGKAERMIVGDLGLNLF